MKGFHVPIGLSTYRIKFKKHVKLNGDACNGLCDFDAKIIEVCSTDSLDVMVTTYWHEWAHAFLHETGATALSEDETFVETLAQNIAKANRAIPPEFY